MKYVWKSDTQNMRAGDTRDMDPESAYTQELVARGVIAPDEKLEKKPEPVKLETKPIKGDQLEAIGQYKVKPKGKGRG